MPQATESQIAMWRGAIALLWMNSPPDEAAKQLLRDYLKENILLSDAQRSQLASELNSPIDLQDAWNNITNPEDRARLIDIAPNLFASHGGPSPSEKAAYDKMLAQQMASIDQTELQKDFAAIKARSVLDQAQYESGYAAQFNNLGIWGKIIYHIDKMFSDVIDKLLSR